MYYIYGDVDMRELTDKQIGELCLKVQQGCMRSQETLLQQYERYIYSRVCKQFTRHNPIYKEDLYQEACMAFIQSCRKYDPTLGSAFSTYATYRMDTALRRFQSRPLKTPQTHIEMEKTYYAVKKKLAKGVSLGKALKGTGVSVENFEAMDKHYSSSYDSLDMSVDGYKTLEESYDFKDYESPYRQAMQKDQTTYVMKLLGELSDEERVVIKHRYEIDGYELLTWPELSAKYGMSVRTCFNRNDSAIVKLQQAVERYG